MKIDEAEGEEQQKSQRGRSKGPKKARVATNLAPQLHLATSVLSAEVKMIFEILHIRMRHMYQVTDIIQQVWGFPAYYFR